jgi:quercetin dioxygenase-like cupin family protein
MPRIRLVAVASLVLLAGAALALAQGRGGLKLVQVLPSELGFVKQPNGTLQAVAVGDPAKAEPYALRVRIPAGTRVAPHFHPDARIVIVMSGTLYLGYGDRFDEQAMKVLPAGSVFTEPAKQAHYTWAKDMPVVLHVTGNGPTGVTEVTAK